MLCGGIQAQEAVTEFATQYVANNAAAINAALGTNNASYVAFGESTQIVNGVCHFLHLRASDNQEVTITLLERPAPQHEGVILEAALGVHAPTHGYGNIVHHQHPNHPEHQPL
jgi:hypothetical protein